MKYSENPQYFVSYRKTHQKAINKNNRKRRLRKLNAVIKILGNRCFVCKKVVSKRSLMFHEIHGKKHRVGDPAYVLKHIKDFIPMCAHCHSTLHVFFKYVKEFEKLVKTLKGALDGGEQTQ